MLRSCFVSSATGNLQCVKGQMDSLKYQEILGKILGQAISEEAEAWASLGIPTGQWSQAHLKFHQGLVAEEVLGDSTVAIPIT